MQLARQRKATGAPTKGNWRTNERQLAHQRRWANWIDSFNYRD
jgi:hypothetical protein